MLNELNYCTDYGWIDCKEVAEFIKHHKLKWMHLIITCRNAAREVIEVADTVTEMKMIKHAFEKGVKSQQGIEF